MTKNVNNQNKKYAAVNTDGAQSAIQQDVNYGFYSRVLQKPFDTLSELMAAEAAYYNEQKAKEDKAAQKKADAQRVEDAFKALNAARKVYKEDLSQLTKEYAEELEELKKAFELGKKDIHDQLAKAEDTYQQALKEFTDKYKEGYHLTLKDGDFETTISGSSTSATSKNTAKQAVNAANDLWNLLFGW